MSEELEQMASDRRRRARRGWWRFAFLLAALAVLALLAWRWSRQSLQSGAGLVEEGRYDEAEGRLETALKIYPDKAPVHDALGVLKLLGGDREAAARHFEEALKEKTSTALNPEQVLQTLISRGDYESAERYLAYLKRWYAVVPRPANMPVPGAPPKPASPLPPAPSWLIYYDAYVCNAYDRLITAEFLFTQVKDDGKFGPPARRHLRLIGFKQARRLMPHSYDRKGRPFLSRNTDSEGSIALAGTPWIPLAGDISWRNGYWARLSRRDRLNKVYTTLDMDVHDVATKAFGQHKGAFIALEPATGKILCCFSSPYLWMTGLPPLANRSMEERHPPASLSKPLVAARAMEKGLLEGVFPFECKGRFDMPGGGPGGSVFCHGGAHGRVEDMGEAIALSCNGVFAKLALALGGEDLTAMWKDMGARSQIIVPPFTAFPLGSVNAEPLPPGLALMRFGLGLDGVEASPLLMAMLSAGMASGGEVMTPYLMERKTNLLDEVYEETKPSPLRRIMSARTAAHAAEWMKTAALHPRGTGREAVPQGMTAAVKTGSYGDLKSGDGWTMGWAPADKPKIAWALWIPGEGVAQRAAVPVTRDILWQLKQAGFFDEAPAEASGP